MAVVFDSIETALKKIEFEQSIFKLVELTEGVGTKKGENNLSQIGRFKAKVLLASGRYRTVHLIVKNVPSFPFLREIIAKDGLFVRETVMYQDVLPAMQDVLEEMGDTEGQIWPNCLASRPYEQLIFEDLGPSGYTSLDRLEQLNLQRSFLVMRTLAKFHALSKILVDKMQIPISVFGEHVWLRENNFINMSFERFPTLVEAAPNWGAEWLPYMEKLKNAIPDLKPKIEKAIRGDPADWVTLNHGDCWTSNILFKNEVDSEQSVDAKLIDMQFCFIGSPAYDLHYFMVTSVKPEVITENLDEMLQKYANSLKLYLLKYGYTGAIPSSAQIKEQFTKVMVLQVALAAVFVPIMLRDVLETDDEVLNIEGDATQNGSKPPDFQKIFDNSNEQTKRSIKCALEMAISANVI